MLGDTLKIFFHLRTPLELVDSSLACVPNVSVGFFRQFAVWPRDNFRAAKKRTGRKSLPKRLVRRLTRLRKSLEVPALTNFTHLPQKSWYVYKDA